MSADPIVYCLEQTSDHREFERLCSALLAGAGYPGIEPLGGTGDKGRDAIIRVDDAGQRTVFAYTIRSDWRAKLANDCARVQEVGHKPDAFVFVCTQALRANEKDFAHEFVSTKYGWKLDLYDIERLRIQLVGRQRYLIAQHPSIFAPPFFPQRGGQSVAESKDTILIDHVDGDHALATWLSRRLSLEGYRTWCRGTAPLAGENPDDSVRALLEARAVQYVPVVSVASLGDELFVERCALASGRDERVLPCVLAVELSGRLPSKLRNVLPADFSSSWNKGLGDVLARLRALGVGPHLDQDRGRQIALRDYLPTRVTVEKPEPVFANVFPLHLPQTMLIYDLRRSLKEDEIHSLRDRWAFVELSAYRLVAFTPPPYGAIPLRKSPGSSKPAKPGEFVWADVAEKDGRRSEDLAKQLAWRSLHVVAVKKGLKFCEDRKVLFFAERPDGEWVQSIRHVDGRSTTVQLTGQRTKGWGERASPFLYQLSPRFHAHRDPHGVWNVIVGIYVRSTDLDGKVYEKEEINRRRKVVTKSWWNKEWLARLLGVVQALETSEGRVEIGTGTRTLVMSTQPLGWQCPVGLDVLALSGMSDLGQEMASWRTRDDDEDEDDEAPALEKGIQA